MPFSRQKEIIGKNITTFYVVRHGETEWNLLGKQQGHLDSPLTERGIRQSQALASALVDHEIDFIYSSDLGRALDTAKNIAEKLKVDVSLDERLRERHLGSMQGITKQEFQTRFAKEWAKFNSGDPEYRLPNGESVRQRHKRTVECVEELAIKHSGERILIVTHGGVLASLFYKAVGLPLKIPRRFSVFNASLNSFSINGVTWNLDMWGDISHLKKVRVLDDN